MNKQTTSWCVDCGPMVMVDEDGCCATCGSPCMGDYADAANSMLDLLWKIAAVRRFTSSRQAARALLVKIVKADSWAEALLRREKAVGT